MPKLGEIYICSFPFTSGLESKPRPALVLVDLGRDCLIARVTSASYSGPLDVEIKAWQTAGLEKPSTVRLTRLVTAECSLLRVRLGQLAPEDLEAIRAAWNKHMRL